MESDEFDRLLDKIKERLAQKPLNHFHDSYREGLICSNTSGNYITITRWRNEHVSMFYMTSREQFYMTEIIEETIQYIFESDLAISLHFIVDKHGWKVNIKKEAYNLPLPPQSFTKEIERKCKELIIFAQKEAKKVLQ